MTYAMFTENLDEQQTAEFDAMLDGSVPDVGKVAPVNRQAENALMAAFRLGNQER